MRCRSIAVFGVRCFPIWVGLSTVSRTMGEATGSRSSGSRAGRAAGWRSSATRPARSRLFSAKEADAMMSAFVLAHMIDREGDVLDGIAAWEVQERPFTEWIQRIAYWYGQLALLPASARTAVCK